MQGIIVKNISNKYTVLANNNLYICEPRGKFRNDKLTPFVGDRVVFDENEKIIKELLPRVNLLNRPRVANIDAAVIVTSVVEPSINLNLLDKFISIIETNEIEPIILLTKLDLIDNSEKDNIIKLMEYYERIGYHVFYNNDLDKLINYLKNKTVVLTGQTGAGKSSLINHLDSSLNIQTNKISLSLGRGKHTTRHTEIYNVKGIFMVDTPGFGSLDINRLTKEEIKNSFIEFRNYECKFRDCNHQKEIGCKVKEALNNGIILQSRYDNYLDFIGGKNEN